MLIENTRFVKMLVISWFKYFCILWLVTKNPTILPAQKSSSLKYFRKFGLPGTTRYLSIYKSDVVT